MARRSAALLMFRLSEERGLEVLLGHMGGPFWEKKDARAWSIPKGEYEEGEEPAAAALGEFEEEMGSPPPSGDMLEWPKGSEISRSFRKSIVPSG